MSVHQRQRGFSLIEVMIVVIVIAILAGIAYPAYADHVRKSRRAVASGCLIELAQLLERHRTTTMAYNGAFNGNPLSNTNRPALACENDLEQFYTVAIGAVGTTTFSLTATPVSGSPQAKDTKCGTLGINQAGTKTETGTSDVGACW